MKTFLQAIQDNAGTQAAALTKHLTTKGLNDWNDLTKVNLCDFRDYLTKAVATSSAKTYLAVLKTVIGRYEDEGLIPCNQFRTILTAKNDKPVKTYLTTDELHQLEQVDIKSLAERYVLYCFLVGAYTGMRISDTLAATKENIQNNRLSYVSIKTGVHATIPCSERVKEYLEYLNDHRMEISQMGYNKAIRRLCQRAGITERVKVRRGGKDAVKEKWECISSHSARISFCTNLAGLDVPMTDLKQMAGHTNIQMTERYIVNTEINLSERALKYFE